MVQSSLMPHVSSHLCPKHRQHRHIRVPAELEVETPQVYPLSPPLEELLETAMCQVRNGADVCPATLPAYLLDKVLAAPAPVPKAAVAWLHFAFWRIPEVRPDGGLGCIVLLHCTVALYCCIVPLHCTAPVDL